MRDHGNYDFVHGCILPEGAHKWGSGWLIRDVLERQRIEKLWQKANGERRTYTPAKQIAYCELFERGHGAWGHSRKQNTSTVMRRHYKSSANKKTRQKLREAMIEELHDCL